MGTEFEFRSKLLQRELRPHLCDFLENSGEIGPAIVEFDPTTVCNYSCPECVSYGLLNKGQFSFQRITQFMEEFRRAGVKGLIFIGGGEPLAHKSMPLPILKAKEVGLSIGLTTNGSLIDRYLDPIADCVSWTRVSVDASTEKTYAKFRPNRIPNAFSHVIANIEKLRARSTNKLGYSFLMIERDLHGEKESNDEEILDAARLARNLGCDYFEVKPSVDEHHNLVPFTNERKVFVREQFEELGRLETSDFRVIYPKSLDHLLRETHHSQPKDYKYCPTLNFRTVVTPSGIYPCPYKRGVGNLKVEDTKLPFDEYWRSKERKSLAARINPSKDCNFYCIRHELNKTLIEWKQDFDDSNDRRRDLPVYEDVEDIFV